MQPYAWTLFLGLTICLPTLSANEEPYCELQFLKDSEFEKQICYIPKEKLVSKKYLINGKKYNLCETNHFLQIIAEEGQSLEHHLQYIGTYNSTIYMIFGENKKLSEEDRKTLGQKFIEFKKNNSLKN